MSVRFSYRPAIPLLLLPVLVASLGFAASAQSPKSSDAQPTSQVANSRSPESRQGSYVIGDDDLLGINVWNEPDFKQSLPVRSDGRITLPLIGSVQAAGRTPAELEQVIARKLEAYIHHPNVTVMVLKMNSRKFNILGRVAKPGSYPLTGTTTVLDAIADAGGFTAFAKEKHIYILREKNGKQEARIPFNYKQVIKGKHPEQNITLRSGDTVIVP